MHIELDWEEKLRFKARTEKHSALLDTKAPHSTDAAMSPKEMLLASIAACSAMDVVSLLQKHKQSIHALHVSADGELTESYPRIFKSLMLVFHTKGEIEKDQLIEAVALSQSKYCGVSAMVAKTVPIFYQIFLNEALIHEGQANFTF